MPLVGGVTMGLACLALVQPTDRAVNAHACWCAANLLVRLSSSAFGVPYQALGAETAPSDEADAADRQFRGACALAGSLLGAGSILFPPNGFGAEARLMRQPVFHDGAGVWGDVVVDRTYRDGRYIRSLARCVTGDPVDVPGRSPFLNSARLLVNTLRT